MTRSRHALLTALALALVICPVRGVAAGPGQAAGERSPVEVIRARNRAVKEILSAAGDSVGPETREKLKDVINGFIDFREFARRALGKYWDERTEKEKADFVSVFRQLIRNSSVKKLEIYKADSVTYRGAETKDGTAKVVTFAYKGRKKIEIDYLMHKVGDQWKAYDIVVDGASTVRTYRDSFYREIARTSYDRMYARLVHKLEEEGGS